MTWFARATASAAACLALTACSSSPPPSEPPTADPGPARLPVEPPPTVPLPGETGAAANPLLARGLLPNGLTFAILRREGDPARTAQFALSLGAGTMHGNQGAADLAVWLLVHGSDVTAGRPGLDRQIETLGGSLSIEQGPLSTWLTVRIAEDRWRPALAALAAALTAAPLGRSALERAQHELLVRRGAEIAAEPLSTTARRLLLGDHSGADHLVSLQDRDPSEGLVFQARNYRPDRSTLVLSVPGDPKAIQAALAGELATWQPPAAAPDAQTTPKDRPLTTSVHWAPAKQLGGACRCALVFGLPDPQHPDAAAIHLLANCVTMDGIGGRLERLQHEAGLATIEWQATFESCAEASALVLTTTTTSENAARLWQLAGNARQSLRDLPPTASERNLARGRTWLSLRRLDADADTGLRARTLRALGKVGEEQLQERLTDLEQPDAITSAAIAAFLDLPLALVVIGGAPPNDLADVQTFDAVPESYLAGTPANGNEQLIAAARPWLDRAVEALGGRDRLARVTGIKASARIATEGAPDCEEALTWTRDGSLTRSRTVLGATVETTIRGKEWVEKSGTDQVTLTPVEANWRLGEIERHPLALLCAYSRDQLQFRLLATQTVDDREYLLLEAVTDRFERLRISIDRESALVRIVESWTTSPEGLPTRSVDTWTDYRTVDGLRVPFRRATVVDDGQSRRVATFVQVQPTTKP